MEYRTTHDSPLGLLTLAADGMCLTGLWTDGQKRFGGAKLQEYTIDDNLLIFARVRDWLDAYFARQKPPDLDFLLSPAGTPFQKRVWAALRGIAYGTVTTYGAIAEKLDCPAAQAIGGAVARNPISIIIPCHRVIGADGTLTGYAGGLERKKWLLALETAAGF